jgi:hypothetical protein
MKMAEDDDNKDTTPLSPLRAVEIREHGRRVRKSFMERALKWTVAAAL